MITWELVADAKARNTVALLFRRIPSPEYDYQEACKQAGKWSCRVFSIGEDRATEGRGATPNKAIEDCQHTVFDWIGRGDLPQDISDRAGLSSMFRELEYHAEDAIIPRFH
jgi:hypothetical protein